MSRHSTEALIKQYWPEHTTCLGKNPPVEDETEGIVCPCGTILGWPRVDEPPEADEFAGPQPDDAGMGAHGPIANMPAQKSATIDALWNHPATQAAVAEANAALDTEGWPERVGTDSTGVEWVIPAGTSDEQARAKGVEPKHPVQMPNQPAVRHGAVSTVQAEDPITSALMVIDPTMPYGPEAIEAQLIDIAARLERGVHFQRGWEEKNYADCVAFDLAYNEALLKSDRTSADLRKAEAIMNNKELYAARAISNMMVKAIRQTMHDLRALQSGYQTIANSVKATTQSYHRGP